VRHSLRSRALLLVFLVNSAVFCSLGFWLVGWYADAGRRTEENWVVELVTTIQKTIAPEGLKVASILRWPSWRFIGDAILVDQYLRETSTGTLQAVGIDLNPVGLSSRAADFPRDEALRAIRAAMETGEPVDALGGRAVPIRVREGTWGGLWYRMKASQAHLYRDVVAELLPWFALSTLLLTGATFLGMRSLVLDPVAQLAEGARRMSEGNFDVRLSVPARRDELAELVRSFNAMSEQVSTYNQRLSEEVRLATDKARAAEAAAMRERRLAAMGELAAGIAHEINNPLGGLQNVVEDLRRADLPAERRQQYLDLLGRGLARMAETVERLRRFTPRQAPTEPVDLVAVCQDALDLVRHRASRLGVQLDFAPPAGPLHVPGLRNDLGHAVLNLLVNALDSLQDHGTKDPKGPRIQVLLRPEAEVVRLVVQDNGRGAPPEILEKLGDLFFTTKDVGRGTGLGLSLVRSAARQQGGHLHLESEVGRSFRAELELVRRAPPEPRP